MRFLPPPLGQVTLNVAILVNRATLVYKPAAYPLFGQSVGGPLGSGFLFWTIFLRL